MRPGEAYGHIPRKSFLWSIGWAIFELIKLTKRPPWVSITEASSSVLCVHVASGPQHLRTLQREIPQACSHFLQDRCCERAKVSVFITLPLGFHRRNSKRGLCMSFKTFVASQNRFLFAHLLRPRIHRCILMGTAGREDDGSMMVSMACVGPGLTFTAHEQVFFQLCRWGIRTARARSAGVWHITTLNKESLTASCCVTLLSSHRTTCCSPLVFQRLICVCFSRADCGRGSQTMFWCCSLVLGTKV